MPDRSPSSRNGSRRRLRRLFGAVRLPTVHAARLASRLNVVSRYLFDLVLWSRIKSRTSELAQRSSTLEDRGIGYPAPVLYLSGPTEDALTWEQGFAEVYRLLLANLQSPDLISSSRYALPSPAFQGVYLWDSAFIAQIWKHWDPRVALDGCRAVIEQAEPDGRLPHVTAHFVKSVYTQPPLVAWSMARVHDWRHTDDTREALDAAYPALKAFNAWLYEHRQLPGGLFFWRHPYESGVENAPRFSNRDESVLRDTTRLAAPDMNAYVMLHNEAMAAIAATLGRDDDRQRFQQQRDRLRHLVEDHLWHEADGLYYDLDTDTGALLRSRTIASLMPLWAAAPDENRAQRLARVINDPAAFNTLIPCPSVALDDPDFTKDMWRGPVWINTAFAVILGLERYGRDADAAELAYRLVDGVYQTFRNRHRIYEFYDPQRHDIRELHRKKGNRWKTFTLGDKPRGEFVGWSGLVNAIVIEHLIGGERHHGRLRIRPRLPPRAAGRVFATRIPSLGLACEVETDDDGIARGVVRARGRTMRFETPFGRPVEFDQIHAVPERTA